MLSRLAKPASGLALLLSLAIVVSACGRRGGLEAPSSELSGFEDPSGEPEVIQPEPDKPFFLDMLL